MGLAYNPKVVTDGLVLHLDAGNPKSYSPNVHPKPLDIWNWYNRTTGQNVTVSRDTTVTDSPVGGVPVKMVVTGTDPYLDTYNGSTWNLAPAAQGETWTVSCYVKSNIPSQAQIFMMESGSGGNYIGSTASTTSLAANTWTRISATYTLGNASTGSVQIRLDGPDTGFGLDGTTRPTLWWDGIQVEKSASATTFNPNTNTNGANIWDLSGNGFHHTVYGRPTYSENTRKLAFTDSVYFLRNTAMSTSSNQTVVMLYSTTDTQELWVRGNYTGSYYLSASASNNYYHGNAGTPTNYVDLNLTVRPDSPTNYRNGNFHMWEAKNVNFSGWTSYEWFGYTSGWTMSSGNVSQIIVYDRVLTAAESLQNYMALRGRYGL